MKKIENVKFDRVFYHFEQISKIPRGSGNEKAISDYLLNFGKDLGLECIQDGALNIIIKKPASKGYENVPGVIIQGHMDMVCEKNSDKEHDFKRDPIDLVVKGDYIYADKTTLGADDGIAIAYSMAILEDRNLQHPAIEVLLTTDEEGGMKGAMSIQPQYINGKTILNIDSREEGKLIVSCSGGINTKSILHIAKINKKENTQAYNIVIRGLKGGHSGSEIHLERGNSNKLMGRFLKEVEKNLKYNLVSINGGAKETAIPRECSAIITINKEDERKLLNIKNRVCEMFKKEFGKKDPDLRIYILESEDNVDYIISDSSTEKAVNLLYMYPDGMNTSNYDAEGGIESSTNLGIVKTFEDCIQYNSSVRSSISSLKDEIVSKNKCLTELVGGEFLTEAAYPEWCHKTDSKIKNICRDVYHKMYGKMPEIISIHSGIECGLLQQILGNDIDMISFGPDIKDIHTPNEHMSISSADRCYEYLIQVLKEIK